MAQLGQMNQKLLSHETTITNLKNENNNLSSLANTYQIQLKEEKTKWFAKVQSQSIEIEQQNKVITSLNEEKYKLMN